MKIEQIWTMLLCFGFLVQQMSKKLEKSRFLASFFDARWTYKQNVPKLSVKAEASLKTLSFKGEPVGNSERHSFVLVWSLFITKFKMLLLMD